MLFREWTFNSAPGAFTRSAISRAEAGFKVTKGPGSRAAGLAMAFKLIQAAQDRWRAVNAPELSRSSAPVHASSTATSSNGPTNQDAIPKPRYTGVTSLD